MAALTEILGDVDIVAEIKGWISIISDNPGSHSW